MRAGYKIYESEDAWFSAARGDGESIEMIFSMDQAIVLSSIAATLVGIVFESF